MLLQATLFVLYMGLFICMGQLVSSSKLPDGTLPVRSFAVSSSHWSGMEWMLSRRRLLLLHIARRVRRATPPHAHNTHTHTLALRVHPPAPRS